MIVTVAFLFTPIVFRTVRAVDARRGRARLRHVGQAARRRARCSHDPRDPAEHHGPIIVELTVRVGYAIFTIATLKFIVGGGEPDEPAWGNRSARCTRSSRAARGGRRSSRRWRIASLVIAVNLIADSVEAVYALMSEHDRRRPRTARSEGRRSPGRLPRPGDPREVLRGVSFEVAPGEAYGLVGESGCGKSTTAFAALRYLPSNGRITGGHVLVDGTDVTRDGRAASCASSAPRGRRWCTRIPVRR